MKTKKHQNHQKTIHQHVERILSHRLSLSIVLFLMFMGVSSFDGRVRSILQQAYAQGWSWMGTYMHHEHPTHNAHGNTFARLPTISGN
jgi:Fe2+ transport system protein B